jgi:predicted nucleic acid-binding protein
MLYLADSNILLRVSQTSDRHYFIVRRALETLWSRGDELCYTSQNLAEFWNVCTRPVTAREGYGLSVSETDRRAKLIESRFTFLPDSRRVHDEWRRLVVAYLVEGVSVHDTRLVASSVVHGITHILSIDARDFSRYLEVTPLHPNDI